MRLQPLLWADLSAPPGEGLTTGLIHESEDLLNFRENVNLMEKGSGRPDGSVGALFVYVAKKHRRIRMKKKETKKVIAERKSCRAEGTGLSHYILMDKKAKK